MWSLEIIQYHLKTPLLFYLLTGAQLLTMINQQKVLIVIRKDQIQTKQENSHRRNVKSVNRISLLKIFTSFI